MKIYKIALTAVIALAAACTPRPEAIAPVSMTGAFSSLSCAQANTQLTAERQNLAVVSEQQNRAATGDAIGVFLVLVPVSKLTGGDKAGEVGVAKGKVLALEQRLASCS